jgi:hypothetical protein
MDARSMVKIAAAMIVRTGASCTVVCGAGNCRPSST